MNVKTLIKVKLILKRLLELSLAVGFLIFLILYLFSFEENKKLQKLVHEKSQEVIQTQKENLKHLQIIQRQERVLNYSRYYTKILRGLGFTHEVSVPVVEKVIEEAEKNQLNAEDLFSLILIESAFDCRAVSKVGAIGLGQIMPSTAKEYGVEDKERLFEPDLNIELTAKILRDYVDKMGGDFRLGLLAYNRGITKVKKELERGKDPSNRYDDKVIKWR